MNFGSAVAEMEHSIAQNASISLGNLFTGLKGASKMVTPAFLNRRFSVFELGAVHCFGAFGLLSRMIIALPPLAANFGKFARESRRAERTGT